MGKRETKKNEIIEHAFSEWSKDHFAHTSLESVARALGITKPALYRYFSGKDALLDEMRGYFDGLYNSLCEQVLRSAGDGGFKDHFKGYNEILIRFFAEHPEYFAYAMAMYIPRSRAELGEMNRIDEQHREIFSDAILEGLDNWGSKEVRTLRGFLVAVGGYLLSMQWGFCKDSWNYSVEGLLGLNRTIVFNGLGNREMLEEIDFEAVQEECGLGEEDLLEPDHIFTAISEVVAESGLLQASLEKIARKAGMTKSSLYFYFENRNDMLWRMIDRERHHVGGLFLERTEKFLRFEEKLYGYFLIFGGYMSRRPDFMAVMNWFRFQRINLHVPNHAKTGMEKYVDFLRRGEEEHKLMLLGMDSMTIIRFIHFILINEINKEYWGGLSEKEMRDRFRVLYTLFLYGVEGA
ncbi:MAG: TetR/AcrR family transcriptional regulator [Sediminispirochaetaceae bacterium]